MTTGSFHKDLACEEGAVYSTYCCYLATLKTTGNTNCHITTSENTTSWCKRGCLNLPEVPLLHTQLLWMLC